jgi:hypothetical protein
MSQDQNIAIAQRLVAGIGEGREPDMIAAVFAENLRFEIQGDDGVLAWICVRPWPTSSARSAC